MFKNYFKIAFRNLLKNKTSSIINIGGLAIGMAVALMIGLWIFDELSFNTYHENYNSIAKLKSTQHYSDGIYTIESHPMPLGTMLRSSFSDDFKYVVMSVTEQHTLSSSDENFIETGNYMQPEAPDMLTLKMLNGTRAGLKELNSIMLSASLAKKLFGTIDVVGKLVKIDNKFPVKVTGVYEDLPHNSDFKDVAFIAPFDFYLSCYDWAQKKFTDWTNQSVQIFTQLNAGADVTQVSEKIKNVLANNTSGELKARKPVLFLQPMSEWHLYSKFENGVIVTSDELRFIWFYGIIGAFVLILACVNFMNLSTARSQKRAKEVGIRKTLGSLRKQLIIQFFSESFVVTAISFLLAVVIVQFSLTWFNNVAQKQLSIPWTNPIFWATGFLFTIFTSVVAGSYPALYLSSFQPVKVLKGTFRAGVFSAIPRKALVIFQFTVSIILIVGTIVVYQQIQYAKNRPVGYTGNGVLQIQLHSPDFQNKLDLFRNELKSTGVVAEVAASASPVTSIWSTNHGFSWQGKDISQIEFGTIAVTPEYGKTIGWQFTSGRDFSQSLASDSMGFVINEAAAKLMGLQNPVGQIIRWSEADNKSFTVLGVVKDMVMESPYSAAYPTIFFVYHRDDMNCMFVKLNPKVNGSIAIAKVSAVFKKIIPSAPFDYSFVNEEFNKKFANEERISDLGGVFALLAIFISCLGLFGLATFVAEQRTKEIGVRKVLGASVFTLWRLLSKDFAWLLFLSVCIGSPIAYYFMHKWLQDYAYRTTLSLWVFIVAGFAALIIVLLTVSFQAIKAAIANPVKSLRTE